MNLVTLKNISKWQGDKLLFDNCSLGVSEGDRFGLVGVNGCGKSTLLQLIAKKEPPDSGEVIWRSGLRIRYLPQMPAFVPDHTIAEHLRYDSAAASRLLREYQRQCEIFNQNPSAENRQALDTATDRMDHSGAWTYEQQMHSIVEELGIGDTAARMGALSGGMIKKVGLAQIFLGDYDLLLLDEPTNHLDIDTAQWLQAKLERTTVALALISHDRYLLDQICSDIYEIDRQRLFHYRGGYQAYLAGKSALEQTRDAHEKKVRTVLRRELEWLGQTPQARTGKQKARKERVQAMIASLGQQSSSSIIMRTRQHRLGKKVLEIHHISKSFGKLRVINDFSRVFSRKERIGIIGPNGSGKTTLINCITGKMKPDSGEIDRGVHTRFGLFEQESLTPDAHKTVIDFIREHAEMVTMPDGAVISAAQLLEQFLFARSSHHTPVAKLSGGERRRLQLVSVLVHNPNFLVFDEPTNDLDINTLSILEDFLRGFSGCLLAVSHDRYFMDRVVDSLIIFEDEGAIREFPGSYSDFLLFREEMRERKRKKAQQTTRPGNQTPSRRQPKLSYKEERELAAIEQEIENLENEKSSLHDTLSSAREKPDELARLGSRYAEIERIIEQKMQRWESLEAKREQSGAG